MQTKLWITFAIIGLALAGCGSKTPKAADPNPVGVWEQKDGEVGTWRLEFKPDGSFVREFVAAVDPKAANKVSGTWRLTMPKPAETGPLAQKSDPLDELQRTAGGGNRPDASTVSATGELTFSYTAAEGAPLFPQRDTAAKVRGLVPAGAKFPPAVKYQPGSPVEEQRPVFTRTAKDGQVSLILGFDALRKIEQQ